MPQVYAILPERVQLQKHRYSYTRGQPIFTSVCKTNLPLFSQIYVIVISSSSHRSATAAQPSAGKKIRACKSACPGALPHQYCY